MEAGSVQRSKVTHVSLVDEEVVVGEGSLEIFDEAGERGLCRTSERS